MTENKKNEASSRRSGFITLVGRPNVGKSSIINALLREKVAAVSSKPQTTRRSVRCILSTDEYQMVIVDTPGLHEPRHELGEFMMREAESAMERVDAICFVTEAGKRMGAEEDEIARRIARLGIPVALIVNKVDRLRDKEDFWRYLGDITDILKPAALVPLSAKEGINLDVLRHELSRLLPEGDFIYPEDVLMDTTERFLAEEIIREKIFELTEQEVPHSVAVVVEEFKSPDEYPELKRMEIRANIIVERAGQKGIVIGERGAKLKSIGTDSRLEMERRFGYPIFLQLWVKVKPGWRKSKLEMERVGYTRG
ncbi:MAG: GTPase Era [Synergistaceae bacterium]|jgi:GTP-binding protein Era|nr:GTPase Era [Synergistaceae bacterium]